MLIFVLKYYSNKKEKKKKMNINDKSYLNEFVFVSFQSITDFSK